VIPYAEWQGTAWFVAEKIPVLLHYDVYDDKLFGGYREGSNRIAFLNA
jgi:hypothetical protein